MDQQQPVSDRSGLLRAMRGGRRFAFRPGFPGAPAGSRVRHGLAPRRSRRREAIAPGVVSIAALLMVLAFAAQGLGDAPQERPNVVLLLADDLGYADVGFNGGTRVATPNLDRLAASGVKLTDFRACPMCSPTRAGLLTGRWPLRFGMMRAVVPPWCTYGLPAEEVTLPELLAPVGYDRRAIIGKWHLGHSRAAHLPLRHGFTRFFGHYNGAIDYFTHQREGELDWHDNDTPVRETGYATDLLASRAVQFIRDSDAERPWLLYVPFNAPHSPYQARPADLEKYRHLPEGRRRVYAAMVHALDHAVGRILDTIESRADADNTLILLFSDNGGVQAVGSNAPWRGAKLSVYEGGTRVCAAIRWPSAGLSGGRTFSGRLGYIDVLPTVLAAAGATIPDHVDGINVLPALRGTAALPRRPWFSYLHQGRRAAASVHDGPWKLIVRGDVFNGDPSAHAELELYNLDDDPRESTNLADRHAGRVAAMLAQLEQFGRQRRPGVGPYAQGREGFVAPRDWVIRD